MVISKNSRTFALAFEQRLEIDSLAQQVEHNTFNVGVMGSSPMRVTVSEKDFPLREVLFSYGSGNRKLLPLQGDSPHTKLPRAMPWAVSFCPIRACGANLLTPADQMEKICALKGQKLLAQGNTLGISSKQTCALKGQKL